MSGGAIMMDSYWGRLATDRRKILPSVLLGIVVSAGYLAPVASQEKAPSVPDSANAEVAPRGQRTATDVTYGDWHKLCFKAPGASSLCRTSIAGRLDTGQLAVRVDLIEREDGNARLQIFLPVGMYLKAGVKLSVDKGSAYPIPYTWCLTNTCIAADVAAQGLIKEMEAGQTLTLTAVDSNILALAIPLPLARFASAHNGAPEKTFEQDIDE
jgi:invasion protein IalB